MVEGGATVAASFVAADKVDEAMLVRSDKSIGEGGIDALDGLPLSALTERLRPRARERVDLDTIESYERG